MLVRTITTFDREVRLKRKYDERTDLICERRKANSHR